MKIGLHDAEFEQIKGKTFPNLALMKISAFYKANGDSVEWWSPLLQYDKVYSSKVFDFTKENEYLPPDTIKGGTGYGLYNELPIEIDSCFPDYSIYPDCDYAIGYLTRGCIRNCKWCVVPKKEGNIKPYNRWQDIVREDINKIVLMDNNILACDYGLSQLEELGRTDYTIDLNQGMDIRLINSDVCKVLKNIKWTRYIRFSCDSMGQIPYFETAFELFKKYKIPKSKVFIYTLITKDLEEANDRVQALMKIYKNWHIYAQAERNELLGIVPNKLQLDFAQRYMYGKCYYNETWHEYCIRHNLKGG